MNIIEYLSPDIWYHCIHVSCQGRRVKGWKHSYEKIIAHDFFTDHKGKTTIRFHPTPLFSLTLEPWSHEIISMEAGA